MSVVPHRQGALGLVLMLFVATLPAAESAPGDPFVCFRVVNEVGWPVARINVTAVNVGLDGNLARTSANTDADGRVALQLARGATVRFVLRDDVLPNSTLRNGTLYLPSILPPADPAAGSQGPSFRVPASSADIPNACPGGAGIAFDGTATAATSPSSVVIFGPPTQGFLEITVLDGAAWDPVTQEPSPLPGAAVNALTVDGGTPGFALTDARGKARLPCVVNPGQDRFVFLKDAFVSSNQTFGCSPTPAQLNELTVTMWRAPVNVEFVVLNTTGVPRSATGNPAAPADAAQVNMPVTTATVAVTSRALNLNTSVGVCGASVGPTVISGSTTLDTTTPVSRDERNNAPSAQQRAELHRDEPSPIRQNARPENLPAYICSAPTDSLGRATLVLPWADDGALPFRVTASAPGYVSEGRDVPIRSSWVVQGNTAWVNSATEAPGGSVRHVVTLGRAVVSFSGVVTDINGTAMPGAVVTFTNATGSTSATAGVGGAFTLPPTPPFSTGSYAVTVAVGSPVTHFRACALDIGEGAPGVGVIVRSNVTSCFTVLKAGRAGLTGTVVDHLAPGDQPAPGVLVCAGPVGGDDAADECDVTDAAGFWAVQVLPNINFATPATQRIRIGANQEWSTFRADPGAVTNSGPVGTLQPTGATRADRTRVLVKIHVQNAADAPLGDADVGLSRDGVDLHDGPNSNNLTDANGDVVDATGALGIRCGSTGTPRPVCDTYWTKKLGYAGLTIPGTYIASATKHRSAAPDSTLYAFKASTAFELFAHDSTTGREVTLTLDPEAGVASVAVVSVDNYNDSTADAELVATPIDPVALTANPNWGSGPDSIAPTRFSGPVATLTLYTAASPYRICSAPDQLRYEGPSSSSTPNADQDAACWRNVTAGQGQTVYIRVNRTRVPVDLSVADPHTGWAISHYNATVRGALPCNSPSFGGFPVCFVHADGIAAKRIRIPWTQNANDLCIQGSARSYTVVPPGSPAPIDGNVSSAGLSMGISAQGHHVRFVNATLCQAWPAVSDGSGGIAPIAVTIRPLRDLSTNFVTGTVNLGTGGTAVGATVEAALNAGGFTCAPGAGAHHTTGVTRSCTATIGADGRYNISVPVIAPDRAWNVTARLAGHYDESYDNWTNSSQIRGDFVLVPRDLPVTVTVIDAAPNGAITRPESTAASRACGWQIDEVTSITVRMHDMRDTQTADPGDPAFWAHSTSASPHPDGTCRAEFTLQNWRGESMPMPAAANTPWPVTTAPYLVEATYTNGIGFAIAMISPVPNTRDIVVEMLEADGSGLRTSGAFTITGRVTDADAIPTLTGNLGVPAWVTAMPNDPGCTAGGVTILANLSGHYTLPVVCPGTYTIHAIPVIGTHWQRTSAEVVVGGGGSVVVKNVAVERAHSDVTVRVMRATATTEGALPPTNVRVFLTGLDVTVNVNRVSTGGIAEFHGLPWGGYRITFVFSGLNEAPPKFVRPVRDEAVVLVV